MDGITVNEGSIGNTATGGLFGITANYPGNLTDNTAVRNAINL